MRPIPKVDALDAIFCTKALAILPPMKEIPDDFKHDGNRWVKVVSDWFFFGLKKVKWTPKPGVDQKAALLAVAACMGDFSPSHEHKKAGCAYLLSEWFDDVTYQRGKP